MSPVFGFLSLSVFSHIVFTRETIVEIYLGGAILISGALLLAAWTRTKQSREERRMLDRRCALGKQIAEFWEDLTRRPPELLESGIQRGIEGIVKAAEADRICWYELHERSGELWRLFTAASSEETPASPGLITPAEIPFIADALGRSERVILRGLEDLPAEAKTDRLLLEQLGIKSLALIPSDYRGKKHKGVLGLTSYSEKGMWSEDFIYQLGCVANIIGAVLERRITDEATQESERRFQCLFEQASIGMAIETVEGRILHVNPAFCSMMGYNEEELLSLSCTHISHPDDEQMERGLFEELRRGSTPSYRVGKRFFRKDGSILWGEVSVSLLNRNHGRPPLVIGMVSDVTAQKIAEASLHLRDQELQKLTEHLIEAQEEERRRISRELHDDIGQRLSLLACELDVGLRGHTPTRWQNASALLRTMHKQLDEIATDIHKLSHELHSSSLRYCGLEVALRDLCDKYSNNHHFEIELDAQNLEPRMSPDVTLCLFRVAQEALANVLKHSNTKRVAVRVTQDAEKVRLTVKDHGVGFVPGVHSGGIGLTSMRERLRMCGGVLRVSSAPAFGAEIIAELPVSAKPAALAARSASSSS